MNEHPKTFDAAAFAAPADLNRVQRLALIAGAVGLAGLAVGFLVSPTYFYRAYLLGWTVCLAVALGSLGFGLLNHMTHGGWGLTARRIFEAATRTFPLLLILFLPIVVGMKSLYEWARPEVVKGDHVLEAKQGYLNPTAFLIRLGLYFAIWIFLSWMLNRLSRQQDQRSSPRLARRFQIVSGPGLGIFVLTLTFAAIDWIMSLQPHWYSTIYGVYFLACAGLATLCFVILLARYLVQREPMDGVLKASIFHDWGKLLLAFLMLWGYFCFSQFLITWSGNLPEETSWYLHRMRNGWGWAALVVVFGHFVIPFALLLSSSLKRNSARLAKVALFLFAVQVFDFFWQIEPSFHVQQPIHYWMYAVAPVGLFGIWFAYFIREYKKYPLLPVNDPYLPEAIAHEH